MTETQNKKQGTVLVKKGKLWLRQMWKDWETAANPALEKAERPERIDSPFVFHAIVIAGCLVVGVALAVFVKDVPAMVISVVLACGVATLLYRILGGVKKSRFNLGVLKLGGSAAVLLGGSWLFNYYLDPQLEKIREEKRTEQFSFSAFANPSKGWFAVDQNTGTPVNVKFTNPVTDEIVTVQVPHSASLPLKLVAEKDPDRYLVLGAGQKSQTALGYILPQHLPQNLISGVPGEIYGPKLLHLARSGTLPKNKPRQWGNKECRDGSMPFEIKAVKFQDGRAHYDLTRCGVANPDYQSSLKKLQANLVNLEIECKQRSFLVAVVAANHEESTDPPWSSFLVIEMKAPGGGG